MQSKWRVAMIRVSLPKVKLSPSPAQNAGCRQPCRVAQQRLSGDRPSPWLAGPRIEVSLGPSYLPILSLIIPHLALPLTAANVCWCEGRSFPSPLKAFQNTQRSLHHHPHWTSPRIFLRFARPLVEDCDTKITLTRDILTSVGAITT